MNDINLGLKIKFDGKDVEGGITISREHLRQFASDARKAGEAAGASFKGAARDAGFLAQQMKEARQYAGDLSNGFLGIGKGGLAVGGIGAAVAVVHSLGVAALNARIEADKLKNSLTAAFGGAGVGRELQYVKDTADKLGLSLQTTSAAYAKLAMASKGTALEGTQTRAIFESVGKATTVMGLSADEANGALLAVSQMISKGTVSAEELRGQLGERLPGAFQIAARAMGMTTAELGKMLEQGQLATEDFLPKFAAELEKTLGDNAQSAAGSAQAAANRLESSWKSLKQAFSDTGAGDAAVGVVSGLTGALKNAIQAMEEARRRGWGGVGQTFAGLGGAMFAYDSPAEEQKRLGMLIPKLRADVEKYKGNLIETERAQFALNLATERFNALSTKAYQRIPLTSKEDLAAAAAQTREAIERANAKASATISGFLANAGAGKHDEAMTKLAQSYKAAMEAAVGDAGKQNEILKSYVAQRNKILAEKPRGGGHDRGYDDAAREAALDYKKLYDAALEYGMALDAQLASETKLTRGEQMLAKARQDLTGGTLEATEALLKEVIAKEKARAADEKLLAARAARAKGIAEEVKDAEKLTDDIEKENVKLREQIETLGMTDVQLGAHKAAKLEVAAATAKAQAEEMDYRAELAAVADEQPAVIEGYRRLAAAKRAAAQSYSDNAGLAREFAAGQVAVKGAEDARQAWQRSADDINRSLTDAIMDGGQSGGELLKNYFRTLVLRPTIQAAMTPVANAMASIFAPGSAGGAAGGGTNVNFVGTPGLSMGGMVTGFGNLIGSSSLSAFGTGMGLTGAQAAEAAALYNAAGMNSVGSSLTAGSGFGAAMPYIGAALLAVSLLMKKGGGPKTEGDSYVGVGDLRNYGGEFSPSDTGYTGHSADSQLAPLGRSTAEGLEKLIEALGGSADQYAVHLGYNSDPAGTAPDNVTGGLIDRATGRRVYSNTTDTGRGESGKQLELEVKRLMVAAIQNSDVNALVKQMVSGVDVTRSSAEELDKVLQEVTAHAQNVSAIKAFAGADPFADYAKAAEDASRTLMGTWSKQTAAFRTLLSSYDGSAAATAKLAAAGTERYQTELALVQQIAEAVKSTSSMFADSARSIRLSVLDNRGKYDFFDAEAKRYNDVLATLTDPALISEYSKKLNDSIMAAWGTLDADQQKAQSEAFIKRLDAAGEKTKGQFDAVQQVVQTDNEKLKSDIVTSIDSAMTKAADAIAAAAATPQTLALRITSDGRATAEVGGWGGEAGGG